MTNNNALTTLKSDAIILFKGEWQWYQYRQNNSSGRFHINKDVSVNVLIQARNPHEADKRAEEIGIYFDGCANGNDCPCCGDRWSNAYSVLDEFAHWDWRTDTKHIHDDVKQYAQALADDCWWVVEGQPGVIVYYADGSVERFYKRS